VLIDTDVMDPETAERIQNLGSITIEAEAYDVLMTQGVTFNQLVVSHVRGDYGDVKDAQAKWDNDMAMYNRSGECRSIYKLKSGKRVIVSTKWNQPLTIIKMEDESEDMSDMQTRD